MIESKVLKAIQETLKENDMTPLGLVHADLPTSMRVFDGIKERIKMAIKQEEKRIAGLVDDILASLAINEAKRKAKNAMCRLYVDANTKQRREIDKINAAIREMFNAAMYHLRIGDE